ncbi:1-acyl-sn-glycerol-3-phosphate acyltransferase [Reichenbachiella versicolor]|uniref:1-acyl-sn-glycerol-3-phosphate acyltransferase n=1 Tax=Reichenbachiella versicolor TaxID=1821036 RepID=UPI000D6E6548|nr:1-acyl-sn-glycerol-3-phosphate acyltransferase [Reichenbachiella versicolor]
MIKYFFKLMFKVAGWSIDGQLSKGLKKCVIIVVPHTSFADFFVGVAVRAIQGFRASYLVKEELFKFFPLAWFLKKTGGIPIARSGEAKNNVVDSVVNLYHQRESLILAMAPEGTRRKVEHFKTGFYRIALGAKVPIIMVAFDFESRVVRYLEEFEPTGDMKSDMIYIESRMKGYIGKKPELSFN